MDFYRDSLTPNMLPSFHKLKNIFMKDSGQPRDNRNLTDRFDSDCHNRIFQLIIHKFVNLIDTVTVLLVFIS